MANVKKKCKVVMLPAEKATCLWIDTDRKTMSNYHKPQQGGGAFPEIINQHLYITSDEQIKEGDWYIDESLKLDSGFINIKQLKVKWGTEPINCKKIIATTDKLNTHPNIQDSYRTGNCLPQPSLQFIQAYIEAYNTGNPIVDVMVEYEDVRDLDTFINVTEYKPKVDKNNYITITRCKESWSREEVVSLLNKAVDENDGDCHSLVRWIQTNL